MNWSHGTIANCELDRNDIFFYFHVWINCFSLVVCLFSVHLLLMSSCIRESAHELDVCSHCKRNLSGLFKSISWGWSVIAGWSLAFRMHTFELLFEYDTCRFYVICSKSTCPSHKNAFRTARKQLNTKQVNNITVCSSYPILKQITGRDYQVLQKKKHQYNPSSSQISCFVTF